MPFVDLELQRSVGEFGAGGRPHGAPPSAASARLQDQASAPTECRKGRSSRYHPSDSEVARRGHRVVHRPPAAGRGVRSLRRVARTHGAPRKTRGPAGNSRARTPNRRHPSSIAAGAGNPMTWSPTTSKVRRSEPASGARTLSDSGRGMSLLDSRQVGVGRRARAASHIHSARERIRPERHSGDGRLRSGPGRALSQLMNRAIISWMT